MGVVSNVYYAVGPQNAVCCTFHSVVGPPNAVCVHNDIGVKYIVYND